jgi:hypothetical protein
MRVPRNLVRFHSWGRGLNTGRPPDLSMLRVAYGNRTVAPREASLYEWRTKDSSRLYCFIPRFHLAHGT